MQRSHAIDLLRVLAIFLVLGRHMIPMASDGSTIVHHFAHTFTTLWNRGGWIGVDLFFVLSGFLVSGLLFREHQKYGVISGKDFLIRRGFKIYPAFWILIGVTAAVSLLRHRFHLVALLSELLFIQNYGPAVWNHTWSLAVEEHFYILLLLFLALLSRRSSPNPFRLVPFAFVVLAALSLGLRLLTYYSTSYNFKILLLPTHLRMDSLFCGVVISYYYHYYSTQFLDFAKRYRFPVLILGTITLAPAFLFTLETSSFISTIGLTLFYLGSGAILIATLTIDLGEHKLVNSVAYVGSHSYSIYLWHMPVALLAFSLTKYFLGEHWVEHRGWGVYFALYIIGTLSLGIIMALLVEFPILRLRDRWFPRKARPLTLTVDLPG